MATPTASMARHPDIEALRMHYDTEAEQPLAQIIDGLAFLTGLYLMISPWLLGFNDMSTLTFVNLFTGLAFALLSLGFASAFGRTHGVTWVTPLIGVFVFLAPWLVSGNVDTTTTIWNNVVAGGLCIVLGLAATYFGMRRTPR